MTAMQRAEDRSCDCDAAEQLKQLISIADAPGRIAEHTAPVAGVESVALPLARGRILAAPVIARAMTPPFANAAMDGYAVATSGFVGEGPWTFMVTERVPAGQRPSGHLSGPSTAHIFTGAPVPEGADAVVMQEDARRIGEHIQLE